MIISTHMQVSTEAQLAELLLVYHIDPTTYGSTGRKSLKDLVTEITRGETILLVEEGILKRKVKVLNLLIQDHQGRFLWEKHQFSHKSNELRERHLPPAEKFLPNEAVMEAVVRALEEEMNLLPNQYTLDVTFERIDKVEKRSPSYPGLMSVYETVYVMMHITVMTEHFYSDFSHTEYENGVPRLTTQWHWITKEEVTAKKTDRAIVELLNTI